MLRRRSLVPVLVLALTAALGNAACGGGNGGAPTTTAPAETTAQADDAACSVTTSADDPDDCTDGTTDEGSGESTTTLPPEASEVVLRGDGLGAVALGDPAAEAEDAMRAALGEPTRDTGWQPAFNEYGTCPGDQIRGMEWDHLVLLFTDGTTELGTGQHLFAWRLTGSPPALGTATGFGHGATAVDAEELYPGQVEVVPAEEPFPKLLVIQAEGGRITAYLDEADTVTNLEAGVSCGE